MKKADIGKRIKAFLIDHIIYSIFLVGPSTLLIPFDNFYSAFPIFMIIVFIAYAFKDIFNGRVLVKEYLVFMYAIMMILQRHQDIII